MRKTVLTAGLALLFLCAAETLKAQFLFNWLSSFLPPWANGNTSGTAYNVGGTSINATTNVTLSGGSFSLALGSSGAQTPTVSGATFTVPGSSNRMQVTTNLASNTNHCDIVTTFTSFVTNVSFKIVDIDKSSATSNTYFDRVTITGSDGTTTYNATISKYDAVTDPNFLIISGNVANVNTTSGQAGNTNSDATDQRGTINVSFGTQALKSVTIRYDNAAGAQTNPADQAIAIGSFSFTQSTLPVNLSVFNGHRQSQDVLLNWTTQQEINAASFIVERSSGANWTPIVTIAARGNANNSTDYTYTDINPQGSLLLYRLKQTDLDGNFKYSNVIRITANSDKTLLTVYPNPFSDQVNVNLNASTGGGVTVIITDALGKLIRSDNRSLYPGNNNFTVNDLAVLPKGIYYLRVSDANGNSLGQAKLLKN